MSPRAKNENERIKDERREMIENAAVMVFASKGLAATKISDIAHAAGISLGLMYHYYGNKEELFEVLVTQAIEQTLDLLHYVMEQPLPSFEKLSMLLTTMIEGTSHMPQVYKVVVQALTNETTSQELRQLIEDQSNQYMSAFLELVTQGQAQGTIKKGDPEELVGLLFVCFQGLAMGYAFFGTGRFQNITAESVLGILRP